MNYLLKNVKKHKKTSSDFNSKPNKKIVSSLVMDIQQKQINLRENIISSSISKKYFPKGRKIFEIKKYLKENDMSEGNTRKSNQIIFFNDFNTKEESKGDMDIDDESSTNNLTSTATNNESILNNTNPYFKKNLLSSSKNIKNNILKNKKNNYNLKKDLKLKSVDFNEKNNNRISYKKNSLDFLSVYKSQSNKEIKNNNININNISNKKDITQRCRHKQVKREIYINNNNNNINRHIEINANKGIINSMRKINNRYNNEEDKSNEIRSEKKMNKISFESEINSKDNNHTNNSITIVKFNKTNLNYNSKKQKSLLDLYSPNNKTNKKAKNEDNKDKNLNNYNKNEKRNSCFIKSSTINFRFQRIKSPNLNSNYIDSNNNISNDDHFNLNSLTLLNDTEKRNTEYNNIRTNDEFHISKCKSINKINPKKIDKMNSNKKKFYKRVKNQNIVKNVSNQSLVNDKDLRKENNISFDEDELDENTLSVTNGKYIENKKCQTMINKVFHFETGSSEIFNNFAINNNINMISNMNYLNKNQSTKSMKDKKNSCNTIINGNYVNSQSGNNNVNLKNINIIIKNNIDYNLKKKKKIKNENSLKKCFTDVLTDNNSNNNNSNKKIINNNDIYYNQEDSNKKIYQEVYKPENSSITIKINKNIINNNKKIVTHKNIRYIKCSKKQSLFYKTFQCQIFKEFLLKFCDINLLNKICLISRKIHRFMKPVIYNQINKLIFNPNNPNKNLKIKKYLMEHYSLLSKFSPALLKKKYSDLKFENNHKNDVEIKKDLTRTFPDNILFKYGNNYYNKLYHVLTAFSNYNKNIGYIQGINFLAAHIIYYFEEEIEEFIFLDALIHKFDLEKILSTTNSIFFNKKIEDITKFMKKKFPKISSHLAKMKLNYEFFTTNWILTLFSNSMETNNLFYIWDYMIIFGWKFFRCFVVSVLETSQEDILKATQNNITFIMKNMLKNKQFNSKFKNIIEKSIQILIEENDII